MNFISNRKQYIFKRLIELADIAENRPLEIIEQAEEVSLLEELEKLELFTFIKER